MSDILGTTVRFRVSIHGLRSVEHNGGLDPYLLKVKASKLSLRARRIKKTIEKKHAAADTAA